MGCYVTIKQAYRILPDTIIGSDGVVGKSFTAFNYVFGSNFCLKQL